MESLRDDKFAATLKMLAATRQRLFDPGQVERLTQGCESQVQFKKYRNFKGKEALMHPFSDRLGPHSGSAALHASGRETGRFRRRSPRSKTLGPPRSGSQ